MGQSGTEVTAVEEMTDNEAITEKKGGGVSRAQSSSSGTRPQLLKCDLGPTRPPTSRRKVAEG